MLGTALRRESFEEESAFELYFRNAETFKALRDSIL